MHLVTLALAATLTGPVVHQPATHHVRPAAATPATVIGRPVHSCERYVPPSSRPGGGYVGRPVTNCTPVYVPPSRRR